MNFYQQPFCVGPQGPVGFVGQPVYPQGQILAQPMQQNPFDMMVGPVTMQPASRVPEEQSYIENILRLNIGKVATVYMNFEGSQWGSKIFKGYVLAAGKDHIILKDLQTETRYILLSVYLDYITFDEEIEYQYPFRKAQKNS